MTLGRGPEVLATPYVYPTRVVRRKANPNGGRIAERGNCEVYGLEDSTPQIRH